VHAICFLCHEIRVSHLLTRFEWIILLLCQEPDKTQYLLTMANKPKKKTVALNTSKQSVLQLISNTRGYVSGVTGNTHFPSPPPLAVITTQVNLLENDYGIAQTKVRGSVAKMRAEEKALVMLLKSLAIYVEGIANGDPDHASDIIASANMPEKKPVVRKPRTFSVVLGKLKGEAAIDNKAVSRGVYIYQMTTDPTNATLWSQIYVGNRVRCTKTGLTTGIRYYFRGAVSIKGVQGDWTPVLDVVMQ
jgi:hypothetical protein